jgi:peptidoglycan/LPS O-acetylase OafA/YrhL
VRYTNIQVLRLVAATGVVLHHLGHYAPHLIGVYSEPLRYAYVAGYAVPLFFAVSGFVLTQAAATAGPGRFLLGRFLRLYPGYWLAVLGAAALFRTGMVDDAHAARATTLDPIGLALWPPGTAQVTYLLGVEWTLIYEVFLSVALVALGVAGARWRPALAAGWLALLMAKMVLWPGFAFDPLPSASLIALSVAVTPFLLGVLVYQVKDRGRQWRWVVLPLAVADFAVAPRLPVPGEWHWLNWGLFSAAAVWLAVQFRQLSDRNVLVRLGDWTYGLYLAHVPLILLVYHRAEAAGYHGRLVVVWVGGAVALAGGLLFGMLEAALYSRLRPLAKLRVGDVKAGWGRLRARLVDPANRA